jgi:hypothetical protein
MENLKVSKKVVSDKLFRDTSDISNMDVVENYKPTKNMYSHSIYRNKGYKSNIKGYMQRKGEEPKEGEDEGEELKEGEPNGYYPEEKYKELEEKYKKLEGKYKELEREKEPKGEEPEDGEPEENLEPDGEPEDTDMEDTDMEDTDMEDNLSTEDSIEEELPLSPIFYKYNGRTYTVDNANFLQRNFSNIDPIASSIMNMCIYKCIRTGCTPYLLYLMVFDETTQTLLFPKYTIPIGNPDESDEETEYRVLDEFKKTLFELYPPGIREYEQEEYVDIFTEDLFRGFFVHENHDLTMVYDATKINTPLSDDKQYYWVAPYEMFASKIVHGLSVDPSVLIEIAKSSNGSIDKSFYHLKDTKSDTIVKDPFILFLCKQPPTSILNSIGFSSEFENIEPVAEDTIQIIYPRINHPKIGTYTFFSSKTNITGAKRFAVFVDIESLHPLYIEPEDEDKLNHLYDPDNTELSTAITFMNGSQQVWCIKSPVFYSEINEFFITNEETQHKAEDEEIEIKEENGEHKSLDGENEKSESPEPRDNVEDRELQIEEKKK